MVVKAIADGGTLNPKQTNGGNTHWFRRWGRTETRE